MSRTVMHHNLSHDNRITRVQIYIIIQYHCNRGLLLHLRQHWPNYYNWYLPRSIGIFKSASWGSIYFLINRPFHPEGCVVHKKRPCRENLIIYISIYTLNIAKWWIPFTLTCHIKKGSFRKKYWKYYMEEKRRYQVKNDLSFL